MRSRWEEGRPGTLISAAQTRARFAAAAKKRPVFLHPPRSHAAGFPVPSLTKHRPTSCPVSLCPPFQPVYAPLLFQTDLPHVNHLYLVVADPRQPAYCLEPSCQGNALSTESSSRPRLEGSLSNSNPHATCRRLVFAGMPLGPRRRLVRLKPCPPWSGTKRIKCPSYLIYLAMSFVAYRRAGAFR